MQIEFLTEYPDGYFSAWAIHPGGQVFNFLCLPDGSRVSSIRKRMENGKWYTLRPKQAVQLAVEIERAVAHKLHGRV